MQFMHLRGNKNESNVLIEIQFEYYLCDYLIEKLAFYCCATDFRIKV